jgi:hypothetical protein
MDYRLCITWIIHQELWGYKVEEKLHLGVSEQKRVQYHWSWLHRRMINEINGLCRLCFRLLAGLLCWFSLSFNTCFGPHGHLQVCRIFYFHMLEGFCFAAFLVRCFSFTWSHSACFPFVFCSCAVFLIFVLSLRVCLSAYSFFVVERRIRKVFNSVIMDQSGTIQEFAWEQSGWDSKLVPRVYKSRALPLDQFALWRIGDEETNRLALSFMLQQIHPMGNSLNMAHRTRQWVDPESIWAQWWWTNKFHDAARNQTPVVQLIVGYVTEPTVMNCLVMSLRWLRNAYNRNIYFCT